MEGAGPLPRKIGALGIRVARGVSFHGIALNVTTDLADFDLIDPCGMPGLRSTSIARERGRAGLFEADAAGSAGDSTPTTESVAAAAAIFAPALARRLGRVLAGDLPPVGDPSGERDALWHLAERLGAPSSSAALAGAG